MLVTQPSTYLTPSTSISSNARARSAFSKQHPFRASTFVASERERLKSTLDGIMEWSLRVGFVVPPEF